MNIVVSVGEAIDKLSILELKLKKITTDNTDKRFEIQHEINGLQMCKIYKERYDFYYRLLMYVNETIWDLTDNIKILTPDHVDFSQISYCIFELNQKRYRIKNWFNVLTNSNVKEQKSYNLTYCTVKIDSEDILFRKIKELNYLSLEYDIIYIESRIDTQFFKSIFKTPSILFHSPNNPNNTVDLSEYTIDCNAVFETPVISYIVGGQFGDFIHSISVICEKYYETGKKGILYINGNDFRNGLEKTYEDTFPVIISQVYIKDYKIYAGEHIDVDLNMWRQSSLLYKSYWADIYKNTYNVEWSKHKWLNVPVEEKWKNVILINTTDYRWPKYLDFKKLKNAYPNDSFVFISANEQQYNIFKNRTNLAIDLYTFTSFYDMCVAINSCKLFVGSLSALLAVSYATHKNNICGLTDWYDKSYKDNIHMCGKNRGSGIKITEKIFT